MFPNLLFTMTLAGSTVFLLYILAYPFGALPVTNGKRNNSFRPDISSMGR